MTARREAAEVRPAGPGAEGGRAGFVLVSVLVLLAVVSAILTTAILQARSGTALTQARAASLRLQGVADGIARFLAYDLAMQRTYRAAGLALPEDGTVVVCRLAPGRTAWLSLQDQGRLIDVNTTPRPAMEEAFRLLGIPDATVLALAAEIVDYRDADDVPEPNGGAEAPQYRARGLARGPKNAPFASPDEIERLPSMTPEIAATLAPVLTVYNEGGRFDLAALIGTVKPSALRSLPQASGPVPSPRQYYRMQVVVAGRRARAGRSALYAMGGSRTGTDFLVWQQAAPPLAASGPDHPACRMIVAVLGPEAIGSEAGPALP
ncbi:hypothetical protein ASG60_01115 [Methylobacterium sp. Leaf469]|uniref:general secretion pathway protein GspK n=1 Tax=Methylobacterium sp. Leaf469 TaxID=1736387 RepID=UPI0006FD0E4C|nr:type II secretion system protein GspK [Methylobacterium sp. Leaf469]KQU05313.1 hypothetical protein ASG60_01115 [Methylobacterium sp. Leaf469]